MKYRIIGLVGIVCCVILAKLAWVYLSGGEGLMRNVWRNAALGALVPLTFYSLVMLFGKPKSESSPSASELSRNGNEEISDNQGQ